jgi:phage-related protein
MTEGQKPESGLMGELYTLGRQLTTAVKALWESEDSRRLRQEIGDGFMDLGQQLDAAIKSAQDSEAAKQFSEQVKATVDKARESDVAGQVEDGLVTGLRELNAAISKLVSSLDAHTTPSEPPAADSGTPPDETPVA